MINWDVVLLEAQEAEANTPLAEKLLSPDAWEWLQKSLEKWYQDPEALTRKAGS